MDEQTVLFDTADYAIGKQFIENVMSVLNGRNLDYIVVNHMEPDHCSLIGELLLHYPDVKIIGNAKTFPMIEQFFSFDLTGKTLTVKEGDTFCSGKHTFRFIMSPMVHWPEAMMTYDEKDKVLFSADAFGTFNALTEIYSTMNLILTESGLMKRAVIIQISSENTARKFKMY